MYGFFINYGGVSFSPQAKYLYLYCGQKGTGTDMAYQAIYRKWRPITFEDVVGQAHITDTLKTEITNNRIAHAYLFCGTRGTGKTTTAKILSRAVNCENPLSNGNPCNECPSCKGILNNTILDVIEIDAASNNGVDNIRELRDEISYTPANVKYKIYIIDEVHMLSTGAFNALLKTLEEPPAHAIFILATTEPHKIPATIQSRCQRFDFRRISTKDIAGRIGEIARKDGIDITQSAIRLVAQLGDGSMRDALSVLDLCNGVSGTITETDIENVTGAVSKKAIIELAKRLTEQNIKEAFLLIDKLLASGRETSALLDELILAFREILICKIMENPTDVIDLSDEEAETLKAIATNATKESLLHTIKVLSETAGLCKTSTNPRVMIEASAFKICDPSTDPSAEAFAARVAKLEAMMMTGVVIKSEEPKAPAPVNDQPPFEAQVQEDDEEEYVFEDEGYEDDTLPPFDISVGEEQEVKVAAPPAQEFVSEAVIEAADEPKDVDVSGVISALMVINPALGSILKQAQITKKDDIDCVVFEEEVFKNTISSNKEFVGQIKKALGTEHLKIMTKDEFNGTKNNDPLKDIIDMAGSDDQISIF